MTLLWPAAAAVSLAIGVRHGEVSTTGTLLLAFATAGAYAFDRWRDGHGVDSRPVRRFLFVSVLFAAVTSAVFLVKEPWRFQYVAGLSLLAGLYIPLKRRLPKNVIGTVAWTLAVSILPSVTEPEFKGNYLPAALVVAGIIFANTTLCDLKSIVNDRDRGVMSISTCFGPAVGRWSAFAVSLLAIVTGVSAGWHGLAATAAGHAILAVLMPRRIREWVDAVLVGFPGPLALLLD